MTPRYCCICARPGHHSHECPDQAAFRQQWHSPKPEPKPATPAQSLISFAKGH